MGEVFTKQNIIMTGIKFTNRKKRRKKLKLLANLFDVGEKFINDTNIHETILKENLLPIIRLSYLI
jgi:hypothetical protein